MSMYGTYFGFVLPLSTIAALVARRPKVCPLASTTYHLRLISLPLGINVDIALLTSKNFALRLKNCGFPLQPWVSQVPLPGPGKPPTHTNCPGCPILNAHSAFRVGSHQPAQTTIARVKNARARNPTHCQTNLFG